MWIYCAIMLNCASDCRLGGRLVSSIKLVQVYRYEPYIRIYDYVRSITYRTAIDYSCVIVYCWDIRLLGTCENRGDLDRGRNISVTICVTKPYRSPYMSPYRIQLCIAVLYYIYYTLLGSAMTLDLEPWRLQVQRDVIELCSCNTKSTWQWH